jgi:hypothetical protein
MTTHHVPVFYFTPTITQEVAAQVQQCINRPHQRGRNLTPAYPVDVLRILKAPRTIPQRVRCPSVSRDPASEYHGIVITLLLLQSANDISLPMQVSIAGVDDPTATVVVLQLSRHPMAEEGRGTRRGHDRHTTKPTANDEDYERCLTATSNSAKIALIM